MIKRLVLSAAVALQTLRANTLHTLLSTTGLVVGVAALVAILSLGDGLERYARNQISTTTSLEGIIVQPKTRTYVDGVSIARADIPHLQPSDIGSLALLIENEAELALKKSINTVLRIPGDTLRSGAYIEAMQPQMFSMMRAKLEAGTLFGAAEKMDAVRKKDGAATSTYTGFIPELVLSYVLAHRLSPPGSDPGNLVGKTILADDVRARVIGVLQGSVDDKFPAAYGPLDAWSSALNNTQPNNLYIRAHEVEMVPALKDTVSKWLDAHLNQGSEAFDIITNESRVAQVQRGIKVFKIVMGMITGISVLVGGIGVMNVLLIAITERTREIGIRKAAGARRKDIVLQFLTESVTISLAGSLFGLLLGLATLAAATPVIKNLAEVPFDMAFSAGSLGIILVVALVVGVGFGTYPAWRAANLSPVDAIRHE